MDEAAERRPGDGEQAAKDVFDEIWGQGNGRFCPIPISLSLIDDLSIDTLVPSDPLRGRGSGNVLIDPIQPLPPHGAFSVVVAFILFIVGILLLVKGADLFVGGGSGLAIRHRISPALIGSTIIAFGTCCPNSL